MDTSPWIVAVAAAVNGIGGGLFFPANTSSVMKAVAGSQYDVAPGMLRRFANVGMVFSFAVAMLSWRAPYRVTSRSPSS